MVLDCRTIIGQFFGWYIYNRFLAVVIAVSDVDADVGIHLQAVNTLLINIYSSWNEWNIATTLRCISKICSLLIPLSAGMSSVTAAPWFSVSIKGSYHSRRISFILLHTFANCWIPHSFSTSLASWTVCHICIQLVVAIAFLPYNTLLCPLPNLLLSLFVKFQPYMNSAFSLHTDAVISSWGTRTWARIRSMKPWLWGGNITMVVCISSPRGFFCSSWWCVATDDNDNESVAPRYLPTNVCSDALTNYLAELFSVIITYVDSDIAGKRVSGNTALLFSWLWPADDKCICLIDISIVDTTILSIVNVAIAGLPHPSWKFRELWGSQKGLNGDGGQNASHVTSIFNDIAAAKCSKVALKVNNAMLFHVIYRCQKADGTSSAQAPLHGGRGCLALVDILAPPAEDILNNISEE